MHQVLTESPAGTVTCAAGAGKYLTFTLAGEEYGLPVLDVREIIKVMDITAVPQMPPHMRGVINLRGKVIPVVDLRVRFGFANRDYDERTCIIVTQVAARLGGRMVGVIVDAVSEVLNVGESEIEPPPDLGAHIASGAIRALAKTKDGVKILLDIDRVLGGDQVAA